MPTLYSYPSIDDVHEIVARDTLGQRLTPNATQVSRDVGALTRPPKPHLLFCLFSLQNEEF